MKLSICMMVKNEEKYLDKCLKSLGPIIKRIKAELIIVDTGSTDKTVQIAKRYTDKLFYHEWQNDFAQMRNITISYAKGEWVLIIDGDEEIEDANGIISFLNSKEADIYKAGMVTIKNIIIAGKESGVGYSTAIRLFKNNDKLKYESSIHEKVNTQGPLINLRTTFIHYGYLSEDKEIIEKKFLRNRDLLIDEIKSNPENVQNIYYLSSTYRKHNDYKDALSQIKKAYDIIKSKNYDVKKHLYIYPQLVFCLIENHMYDEARKVCMEGLELEKDNIDLNYSMARLLFREKSYDLALEHYENYINLHNNDIHLKISDGLSRVATLNRQEEAYIDMAAIYVAKEEYNTAEKLIQKVKTKEYIDKLIIILIDLYVKTKKFNVLKVYFEQLPDNDKKDLFIQVLETYREKLPKDEWIKIIKEFAGGKGFFAIYFNKVFELEEKGRIPIFIDKDAMTNKMLCRYILTQAGISDDQYNELFEEYLKYGIESIMSKSQGMTCEEKFFLEVDNAKKADGLSEKIKHLKEAVKTYPAMARGIKFLLGKLNNPQDEIEQYKYKIRNTVLILIESGKSDEAKKIIDEYIKIIKDDDYINELNSKINW